MNPFLQMLDDVSLTRLGAAMTTKQWEEEKKKSLDDAEDCCATGIRIAMEAGTQWRCFS